MTKRFLKAAVAGLLTLEARAVLAKYRPTIVAVTGSVGKTSTKDAVYAALSAGHFVRKSEKSFNSEIGIPLAILGAPNAWMNPFKWVKNFLEGLLLILLKNHYPRWLVLEVGADRPGDIARIARWLRPHVVVVTRIPDVPVHVEFFPSPEALADEKARLVRAIASEGILVLNRDDCRVAAMRELHGGRTVTYGFERGAEFAAERPEILFEAGKPAGMRFRVNHGGSSTPVTIRGVLGRQHVYPALAALAVAVAAGGVNLVAAAKAIEAARPAPGRMRILDGVRGSVVIDDSYNSSPAALTEAIEAVREIPAKRKIAVLGDMLELGAYSAAEHKKAGERAADVFDRIVTVGVRARAIAEAARGKKPVETASFHDSREAAETVSKEVKDGDLFLVKGSQSVRLERVVERLLAEPERAAELLPRQDAEWKHR